MTSELAKKDAIQGGEQGIKERYEAPRVVPLGELARGTALCGPGTFPGDECMAGGIGFNSCTQGTAALTCGVGQVAIG